MKKTYIQPQMEVANFELKNNLQTNSLGISSTEVTHQLSVHEDDVPWEPKEEEQK